jgi:hypothetical protein
MSLPPLLAGAALAVNVNLPIMMASGITLAAWIVFIIAFRRGKHEVFHEV